MAEFQAYIRNNQESIPNYGERYRQGGNDQHGVRRIHDQSGRKPALRQKTTDALDTTRGALAATNTDEGPER